MKVEEILKAAAVELARGGIKEARREAESLLAHALRKDAAWVLAHAEAAVPPVVLRRFRSMVARRVRRIPYAYVVGEKWFYGRPFLVTPAVLIPRPETELLVEAVLAFCQRSSVKGRRFSILDVGTGSGAVGLTLAAELRAARVTALDISVRALRVARRNAALLKLDRRVSFARADILKGRLPGVTGHRPRVTGPRIVVANLPYLPERAWRKTAPEVHAYEPKPALVSGRDGLRHYRALFMTLARWKRPPDLLALEAEPGQFAELRRLAGAAMPSARVEVLEDLHGDERILIADARDPAPSAQDG
jgi:release factor glutamine methyltransferase